MPQQLKETSSLIQKCVIKYFICMSSVCLEHKTDIEAPHFKLTFYHNIMKYAYLHIKNVVLTPLGY